MQGRPDLARARLLAAVNRYALSPKPTVALASLLQRAGRHRAAIRWFERTLDLAHDPSDEEAWTAAFQGGLCSAKLAYSHPSHAEWLLPRATHWLTCALESCPAAQRNEVEAFLRQAEALHEALAGRSAAPMAS